MKGCDTMTPIIKVEKLQEDLKKLGYYKDEIDNDLGIKTTYAIISFQQTHSLQANGIANEETLTKIKEEVDKLTRKRKTKQSTTCDNLSLDTSQWLAIENTMTRLYQEGLVKEEWIDYAKNRELDISNTLFLIFMLLERMTRK